MTTRVRVQRDSSLHEKTVQQAEAHARAFRKGRNPSKAAATPVERTTVDPAVWKKAMALAGGDGRRIEVKSPTVVIVHNNGGWRR